MKLIKKYLISDKTEKKCFHCHQNTPEQGKNICGKCSKELEAWRNKKNKGKTEE